MPISVPSTASAIIRASSAASLKRPLTAAYVHPTRLAFIHTRRASGPAALVARHAGAPATYPPGSLSPRSTFKAAMSVAPCRGMSTLESRAPAATHAASATTDPLAGPLLRPDPAHALSKQSVAKLIPLWFVYMACGSPRLVQMAPGILKLFEKLHLSWLSNAVMRRTFFAWFCAGEKEKEIVQAMRGLKESGVGSILDFSAEADLAEDRDATATVAGAADTARAHANVKADAFAKEYLHGLHMSEQVPGSFAAIKVTGLADPEVLYRLSMPYRPMREAFVAADHDNDGRIDFTQFKQAVLPSMPGGDRVSSASGMFSMVDTNNDGQVDWVDLQMALGLDNPLARPLYLRASPTSEYGAVETDFEDYERMISRSRAVAQQASDSNVRIMVDAEHSYFQPLIDHVALVLQREFNAQTQHGGRALIFNTYQMYRADSFQRMVDDYERAAREGWRFAAKLVRGAYMELERERAAKLGYASPINPTLEATHASYNKGVSFLMQEVATAQAAGAVPPVLFAATHNNASIEMGMQQLRQLNIDTTNEPVMFGQLLGMQDAVSYAIAKAGLPIYKYVPYGPLEEVMPYLIRRAQENSAVASSIRKEASAVLSEIRRRLTGRSAAAAPTTAGRQSSSAQ